MLAKLLNYFGFYIGWLACVNGAAAGRPWWGVVVALALVAVHVMFNADRARELRALAAVGLFGLVVETVVPWLGLYRFASGWEAAPWLAPAWIVCLWLLLAATFESSLAWCASRPWLSAALAGVSGPLSFAAAEAIGAVTLLVERSPGLLAVGLLWATAFPAACALSRWASR